MITGTSTGFGKLTVKTLAQDGHHVFATMRGVSGKNKKHANELEQWAAEKKLQVDVVELDVTSDSSVKRAADYVLKKTDRVDVVVNNAGIYASGIDESFSIEDYKNVYEVNVFGPLRVNRAFLPTMRKHGNGLLVQISSLMGQFVIPFAGIYTSSKWAVEGIAESLRYELAPMGIDSVIVEPGVFQTEIFHKIYQPENEAVKAAYTSVMPYMNGFSKSFKEMLTGDIPNKPQQVADAIKALIDTPHGERPLRVTVDKMMPGTAEPVNEVQEKVQESFLEFAGLSDLLKTRQPGQVTG